jgi:four helix bundle protein
MKIHSYQELIVWQKSIILVEEIYRLTTKYPKSELFGICSQMRRAAISIPSNIAEGYGRRSRKEYIQFYAIAYGSILELQTQIVISFRLGYLSQEEYGLLNSQVEEVIKMLYVMTYKLKVENKETIVVNN